MSANSSETAAIVLDCLDHGESDKIITFFSAESGRMAGIAKGANRSKKRFQNKLELFSHVTLSYNERQRSSLVFITEADLHCSYMNLRKKIDCYIGATFIRETLLLATTEREGDAEIFRLLLWSLQAMDDGRSPPAIATIFLLRLYAHLGYKPDLSDCRCCGRQFTLGQRYSFHHMSGGLICSDCTAGAREGSSPLSIGTIRLLSSALNQPLERLHRLQFSRQAQLQSLTMLHRYGRNLFQREIQSWKALRGLLNSQ